MAEIKGNSKAAGFLQIERIYEQPHDAITLYSDIAQVTSTGSEIVVQFYETIPGIPTLPSGQISRVTTRLRATITISIPHAINLGKLLMQKSGEIK